MIRGAVVGRCVISLLSFDVIQSAAQTSSNAAFLLAPRKKSLESCKLTETVGTGVTSVVGDDSQVLQVTLPHSLYDSFGSTTESKTSGQDSLTVLNVSDSSLCIGPDLRLFAGSNTRSAMSALGRDGFEV